MPKSKKMTPEEAGRKGGLKTAKRGKKFYSKIGKKGASRLQALVAAGKKVTKSRAA